MSTIVYNIKGKGKLKYFVLVVLLCLGGFVWAGFNGYRFLGDDVDEKELHQGKFSHSGTHHRAYRSHHFYHK